jgi:hypothetical protein
MARHAVATCEKDYKQSPFFTVLAGTKLAQIQVGIDAIGMVVIPKELHGIMAHLGC